MAGWLGAEEPMVRLGCFLVTLTAMALWERAAPRRSLALPRATRGFSNLGLMVLGGLAARLLVPMVGPGVALFAARAGSGMFNPFVAPDWVAPMVATGVGRFAVRSDSGLCNQFAAPAWVALPVSVVVLDAAIYLQHMM